MCTRMSVLGIAAMALLVLAAGTQAAEQTQPVDRLKVIYFGNSLTACSNPDLHEALGKSVGRQWDVTFLAGAGWQVNFHRFALLRAGLDISSSGELVIDQEAYREHIGDLAHLSRDRGDLTIDESVPGKFKANVERFISEEYDAMLLQPFHAPLKQMADERMGVQFDKPRDVGELQACIDMVRMYLAMNPEGRVYIYQNWPNMEGGEVPPEDELPDWARRPGARVKSAEFPKRDEFDYEHEWLGKKYSPDHPDRPWLDNLRCKDIVDQLFEGLKAEFPELWEQGRLEMIPVGDVWMALHRKMQAGDVPGFDNITDFYTDVQHIRIGLPRYSVAASFYAVMFRDHPRRLDWRIYNDKQAYMTRWDDPYYDLNHDKGELIPITPQTAQVINDTIWEVVTDHPYTNLD